MSQWYNHRENLRELAAAIEEVESSPPTSEFLEKPWKWEPEWNHLRAHGNLKEFEG